MKSILFKSIICIITVFVLFNFISIVVYAGDEGPNVDPKDKPSLKSDNENFNLEPYGPNKQSDDATVKNATRKIIGAILGGVRIAGTGIALIMITIIAIKYMMAAPGDRADIKKSSFQYVVGAVIVFGSTQILTIIIDFASKLFK